MAEGGSLLNCCTGLNLYRGFESHPLRQPSKATLRVALEGCRWRGAVNEPMFGEAAMPPSDAALQREGWDCRMPSEYRLIFFDPAEVATGAVEWKRAQGGKVPSRKVVRMEVDNATLAVKLHFAEGKDKAAPLELKPDEVTAALLTYCRKASIPLPMRAAKKVIRQGDQLTFMISMPSDLEPPTIPVEYTGEAPVAKSE